MAAITAIVATTIAEIDFSSISVIVAIAAIIWKATLQRSHGASQRPQIKYRDALRTLTLFKMAANTNIEKAIVMALFMEEVQKYDCLYSNFQRNIETSTRKSTAGKQSERNWIYLPNMSSLSFPSTMITRKHTSSRSRQFTAAMLNLRNGANYVVRPRSPRSSFSDRSDHMETINRCDRWTIFVSDHSDGSDHMESRI